MVIIFTEGKLTEGKIIIDWEELNMKKICAILVLAGIMLALVTAGGADADSISIERMFFQALLSALLVLSGTHGFLRGERA